MRHSRAINQAKLQFKQNPIRRSVLNPKAKGVMILSWQLFEQRRPLLPNWLHPLE